MSSLAVQRRVIPGFSLSLGFAVTYLSLVVLVPLAALVIKGAGLGWGEFARTMGQQQVQSAFYTSLLSAFLAALINVPVGLLIAWVLVRYRFVGRRVMDAIIDLPFALPTAVAGISLAFLYGPNGWIGKIFTESGWSYPWLVWAGFEKSAWPLELRWFNQIGLAPLGVTVALTFVSLPFVVRTLQPVLEDLGAEHEEAAASLGANRIQTIWRVVLPEIWPALITGFALAFARGIGEYGSVLFITGNQPETQIVPHVIFQRLERFEIAESTVVATILMVVSFVLLLGINLLQRRVAQRGQR